MTATPNTKFSFVFAGRTVYGNVALCSKMARSQGLRFSLSLAETMWHIESEFIDCPKITAAKCEKRTYEQLVVIAERRAKMWVKRLKNRQMLVDAEVRGKAHAERGRKLYSEINRKAADRRAAMKAKGFTHVTLGSIHRNGNDRSVEMFTSGKPTAEQIAKLMRGSAIKTTYSTSRL